MITLIANSGIQFHKFELFIEANEKVIDKLYFYQKTKTSTASDEYTIEYARRLDNGKDDVYIKKINLKKEGFLTEDGKVKEEVNFDTLGQLNEDDCFQGKNIHEILERYVNYWLPVPYFNQINGSEMKEGPFAWSRMFIRREGEIQKREATKYTVILAFDTSTSNSVIGRYHLPKDEIKQNFAFNTDEDLNLNFISSEKNGDWITSHLKTVSAVTAREKDHRLKHLGDYLYLLKYLSHIPSFLDKKIAKLEVDIQDLRKANIDNKYIKKIQELTKQQKAFIKQQKEHRFPEITFYKNNQDFINVNLVLDIGNANTFGILFEEPKNGKEVDFAKMRPLSLYNLSEPGDIYDEPFAMTLAVSQETFGKPVDGNKRIFQWPSLVRLGAEAKKLINSSKIQNFSERNTSLSSPKRYLWDTDKSENIWIDIKDLEDESASNVFIKDITNKFTDSGELITPEKTVGVNANYSRSSMMTFSYLEIFTHAVSQINSFEYRSGVAQGNNEIKPRRLKRIIITAPTSIVKEEQILLRQRAEEALKVLNSYIYKTKFEETEDIELVPSIADLKKDLSEIEEKKDWNYDEASVSQLLFLYAEINRKFSNKADNFFNLYGKKRKDLDELLSGSIDYIDSKPVTIATLDIGGGTADLIITAYLNKSGTGAAYIKPYPLFFDSFNKAGDDLLEKIVESLIVNDLKEYANNKGLKNVDVKINELFGEASDGEDNKLRIMRLNFVKQISQNIALKFLEFTGKEKPKQRIKYSEIFENQKPNGDLISYINEHFSDEEVFFNLLELEWDFSVERMNQIIDLHFDKLFRQIALLMSYHGADFLLLAGKLTTLPQIRNLLIKYYPLPPNRIITLNKYKIGTWYPFADKKYGYFKDGKTIVAAGALISFLAGKLKIIQDFSIDTKFLKEKIVSTANYIGKYDTKDKVLSQIYLEKGETSGEVKSTNIPHLLGYKQLSHKDYPARPMTSFEFDNAFFEKKFEDDRASIENNLVLNLPANTERKNQALRKIENDIETLKERTNQKMPFKLELERDSDCKEKISLEEILDKNDNNVSKKTIKAKLVTLSDKEGYWLDTGKINFKSKG